MKIEEEIIKYYERYDESKRLASDIGPLELVRTQELIKRFLPSLPAIILDVGGATGVYSYWLAAQKYTVHLVDIVPRHIERAKAVVEQADSPKLASLRVGDARKLDFGDGYADMVMLHGPLYHLADKRDRLVAIAEAKRVLKAGGLLLAFAITRYAGLIYGLTKGLVFNRDYLRMIVTEVETGQRVDPPPGVMTFPNAYFHLPQELEQELREAGLQPEATLGIIGPSWLVPDLEASWGDQEKRQAILEIARLAEREPVLGPRILSVARKSP